jgi:hypothetical protein
MSKHAGFRIRGSSVSMATGHGLDDRVSISGGARFFSLQSVQTGSEANPASDPIGTVGSFPGIKRQGL